MIDVATVRFYGDEYQRQLKFGYGIGRFNEISRVGDTLIWRTMMRMYNDTHVDDDIY